MTNRSKCSVLGVQVNAIDYEAAVERIIIAARQEQPFSVTALAVHGVMTGVQDPIHLHRLNSLDLVVPDGQPVRWAMNIMHKAQLADRVYGPTLMLRICEQAAHVGLPIYLYGATSEMLEKLAANLEQRFPDLEIAGMHPSRFRQVTAEEQQAINEEIRSSGARVTFVGIGCPRQEVWAYENAEALGMPVIAVGAAFAFHAGMLSQAPLWMQKRGLEWLYRLVKEPRRLWRRYVILNPVYIALVVSQIMGLRQNPSNQDLPVPDTPLRYG